VQWFVLIAVGYLTIFVMHLAATRGRKTAQHGPSAAPSPVIHRGDISSSPALPDEGVDARIARIIREIPQRRVRQHSHV
jgi:hypothetical protein